jgi:vacuolar-type H+-ATPase catalytic subunit A/Vma1
MFDTIFIFIFISPAGKDAKKRQKRSCRETLHFLVVHHTLIRKRNYQKKNKYVKFNKNYSKYTKVKLLIKHKRRGQG